MKRTTFALVFAALLTAVVAPKPSKADAIEDFYRGKSLRMLIGYGPGGGYDLYARLVAEFLPRFLPGRPTIVPQNMPAGGSSVAAKFMAEAAPHDGTVFGSVSQTMALDTMVNPTLGVDFRRFAYLGRAVTNIDIGAALPKSGIKSFEDVRKREFTVGASGGGSTTVMFPSALASYAGAKFKIVRGYKGTTEIVLAMDRGEVDIIGAFGLPGIQVSHPGWLNGGEAVIIYQAALHRHRLIPDVPTLPELALTDEGRAVLTAVSSTGEIGRSIVTTPDVPAERLAALRGAFASMLKDPGFNEAAAKRKMTIDPGTGEELDAIVRDTFALPKSVIDQVGAMMK